MGFIGKWFGFGQDPHFDDGLRAYERQAFEEAVLNFRNSAQSHQDRTLRERAKSYLAGALGKLAAEAVAQRDFERAEDLYNEATLVRPDFADLWHHLGRVQLILGDSVLAQHSAEKALALNPRYGAATFLKGMALIHQHMAYDESPLSPKGDLEAGYALVDQAAGLDPRLDTDQLRQALRLKESGDLNAAYTALKEVRPAPSQIHDLIGQGNQAAKQGQWVEAESLYQQALDLAPQYADIAVLRGQTLLELNRLEEAVESFQFALKANPDYAEGHALMGIAYRRLDQEENAVKSFNRALKVDPDHPIARQELLYRRR